MITTNPASFYIDQTNVPIGVSITLSAYDTETKLSKHVWYFDDNTLEYGKSVTHAYTLPGVYTIKHVVCDYANNSFITTTNVTAYTPYRDSITMTLQPAITAGIASVVMISVTSTQPPPHNVIVHLADSESIPARVPVQFFDHLLPRWGFYAIDDVYFTNALNTITVETTPIIINESVSAAWCGSVCVNLLDHSPGNPTLWATLSHKYNNVDINSRTYAASSITISSITANTTNTYVNITHDGIEDFRTLQYAGVDIPIIVTVNDDRLSWPYIIHYTNKNDDGALQITTTSFSDVTTALNTSAVQHCVSQDSMHSYYKTVMNTCTSNLITAATIACVVTASINSTSIVLTGSTPEFYMSSLFDYNQIRLINENFDLTEAIKTFMPQFIVDKSPKMFNEYYPAIFGDPTRDSEQQFGIKTFERISNFITNHGDVDTCDIENVFSKGESMQLNIDQLQLSLPNEIKRIVNIASINPQRLWGTKCACNMTFDSCADCCDDGLKCTLCKQQKVLNRGDRIDTSTYTVTAGIPIVFCPVQTRDYELLYTIPVSGNSTYAIEDIDYTNLVAPLSSNYTFFHYLSAPAANNIENLIDWSNCQTLLDQNSSQRRWLQDDGNVEEIARYLLTSNLRLATSSCVMPTVSCEIPECS